MGQSTHCAWDIEAANPSFIFFFILGKSRLLLAQQWDGLGLVLPAAQKGRPHPTCSYCCACDVLVLCDSKLYFLINTSRP